MAYEKRYKERALGYLAEGHTYRATAKLFGISPNTLARWRRLAARGESLESKVRNRPAKKIDPEKLRAYIAEHPDAYLSEIAQAFDCSSTSVSERLRKLGITRKKRR